MSGERASEQLRELVDSHGWPPHGLKEAMPEIIAVVEAAERIFGYIEPERKSGPTVVALYDGLDALTSKLSGEGQ